VWTRGSGALPAGFGRRRRNCEDVLADTAAEECEPRTDLVRGVGAKVGDDFEVSTGDSLADLFDVARVGDEPLHGCGQFPADADAPIQNRYGESPLDG
jgi:hypothetical protein